MDFPFPLGARLIGLPGSSEDGCAFTVAGVDPPAVAVTALNEFWAAPCRLPRVGGPYVLRPGRETDWVFEDARNLPWFIFRADGTFVHYR